MAKAQTIDELRAAAKTARAAADASVEAQDPKERQRELAADACAAEEQVQFADWVKIQEDAGYTVEGDTFATAQVVELPPGPDINVETSG